MFKISPSPAPAEDISRLEQMAHEYEKRILWKLNQIEGQRHETVCTEKCVCRTRQEEIHEWEDWAITNFDKPWDQIVWSTPEPVAPAAKAPRQVLAELGIPIKRAVR